MIFSELNPILQTLLASLQSSERARADSGSNEQLSEQITTFRIRSNMIRRLIVAIEGVSQVHGGSEALVAMAEFVLLPLILVLQSGVDMRSSAKVGGGPPQLPSLNQYLVLRSAQMRCVEDAAVALGTYFDSIGSKSNSLDDAILLRCLVSCTMSLSAVEMALRFNGDDTNHSTALDDGDDCRLALLKAISCLCVASQETGRNPIPGRLSDSSLSRTIATHMDGVLMIRVVGGCMTILQGLLVDDDGGHFEDEVKIPTGQGCHGRGNWKLGLSVLDTLDIMLRSVPHQEVWRNVLPGAFATLFRVSLKSCRTRASGTLSSSGARAISIIALLLRVSIGIGKLSTEKMGSCFTENTVTTSGSTSSALPMTSAASRLFSAASLAGGTSSDYSDGSKDISSTSTESAFRDEVNARLPGPLTMIIRIGSVHSSAELKRAIINLVDALLVDTRTCWSQTTKDALFTVALECCLSLLNDGDGEFEPSSYIFPYIIHTCRGKMKLIYVPVCSILFFSFAYIYIETIATMARATLCSYRKVHTEGAWKEMASANFVPRVVELIQALPYLASRGHESELRARCSLISGYVRVTLDEMVGSPSSKEGGTGYQMDIGSALACEEVSSVIRRALAELLQLDHTALPLSSSLIEQSCSLKSSLNPPSRTRFFAFLREEASISATMDMLNLLGRALGPRNGSIFVDACIADLSDNMSSSGKSHVQRQCSGLPVLAGEILSAAFESRSKTRILQSLVSSILPIITRPPLWSLPTYQGSADVHGVPQSQSLDRSALVMHSYLSSGKGTSSIDNAIHLSGGYTSARGLADLEESPPALTSASAIFVSALLQIINVIAHLLQESMAPFLPIVLYCVVEKTSPVHHHHVRQSALVTLEHLSKTDGCSNINIFLAKHFDYLVDSIIGTLRRQSGRLGEDLLCSGVVDILLRSLGKELCFNVNVAHLSLLTELVDVIMVEYDDSLIYTESGAQRDAALSLLKIFDAATSSFGIAIANTQRKACEGDDENVEKRSSMKVKDPWLTSLADFNVEDNSHSDDEDGHGDSLHVLSEENFCRQHQMKEEENSEGRGREDGGPFSKDETGSGGPICETAWIASVIATSNGILSRCCYLLSISDLIVRRNTCKTFISTLRLLALSEEAQKNNQDGEEASIVGNVLFMSISSMWPSIHQQLKIISQQFRAKDSEAATSMLILAASKSQNTAPFHDKVFIAGLFELIGCVCELSGDFMTSRFESDVWPIIAELISHEIMLRERRTRGQSNEQISSTRKAIASANHCDNTLSVIAILRCISQSFQPKVLGSGLVGLVSSMGTLILPLLADDGDVGDAAEGVVRALLILDSDALWRSLVDISGGHAIIQRRRYKSRPSMLSLGGTTTCGDINNTFSTGTFVSQDHKTVSKSNLTRRAIKLLGFADGLDEQLIT